MYICRRGSERFRLTSEAQASAAQIPELLKLRPDAVLVGGQALAVWASALRIKPDPPLDPYVTSDIDFLATQVVARQVAKKLDAKVLIPSPDGHVQVNSAVLVMGDNRTGHVLVDFLNQIAGLDTDKVKRRALEIEAFGTVFQVMHPVDCLASRISNLQLLPQKRNEIGLAQTKLAIKIVRTFIEKVMQDGNERHALDLADFVGRLARSRGAAQVSAEHGINILDAIPLDVMPAAFREKQWPRVVSRVERRTKPYRKATA